MIRTNRAIFVRQFQESTLLTSKSRYSASFVTFPNPSTETITSQQIYEEVWGEEYFYDDSNIMAIISRLRKKLEVNPSSPKYIQTVKGIGYRFNKEV